MILSNVFLFLSISIPIFIFYYKYIKMKKIAETLIPKGVYCMGCPYRSFKSYLPDQEDGYCAYLQQSDWDRNEKAGKIKWRDGKTGKISTITAPHEMPMSLLWDGCKECGINDDIDENEYSL